MAGTRTLKLSILADIDNLKKNLDQGSKEVDGFGGKLEKFGKVAAAAFAAAAAAAVAYAGKLAIDGVKAAIEDEAAQLRLANALKNVTGATTEQIASVESQIEKLALAKGVADDALRPAFQRLATATGDLNQSQKLLNIALDVSAATGKPLEAVTNALGKAYEGNTSSLARLGIGMSAAEIKALGLEGSVAKLAETFQGAADVQANSFQGRIERLKVAFDEAKETIGQALLPILEKLLSFITDNILPVIQRFTDAFDANKEGLSKQLSSVAEFVRDFFIPIWEKAKEGIDNIRDAIEDNKHRFEDLWETLKEIFAWINKYLVPLFKTYLVLEIQRMSKAIEMAIRVLVPVAQVVANAVKLIINSIIETINNFIKAYNLLNGLWGGKDVPLLTTVGAGSARSSGGVGGGVSSDVSLPPVTGGAAITGGGLSGGGTSAGGGGAASVAAAANSAAESAKKVADAISQADWMPTITGDVARFRAAESGDVINVPGSIAAGSNFDVGRFRQADNVIINVNAPSIVDEEGFSRAIKNALNEAENRGTVGGGGIRLQPSIL